MFLEDNIMLKFEKTLPVGLQVYSVRDYASKDLEDTMTKLKEIGYDYVEPAGLYGKTAEEYKAVLDKCGLTAICAHVPYAEMIADIDKVIADYTTLGVKYIAVPYLGEDDRPMAKNFDAVLENIRNIGKKCAEAGLKYGYHNHSFEFNKVEDQVMIDYMIQNTDPQYVFFEMDVYWTVMGKASPVAYFKKYPGRFKLLHIKDHKEIGQSGMVGFDAIFKNAEIAGVEHIIVEAEAFESADMMEGVGKCADYLLKADFVKADYTK